MQFNSGTILRYWPQNGSLRAVPTNLTSNAIVGIGFSPNDEIALITTQYFTTQGNLMSRILYWNETGLKIILDNIPPTPPQSGDVDWSADGAHAYAICSLLYRF